MVTEETSNDTGFRVALFLVKGSTGRSAETAASKSPLMLLVFCQILAMVAWSAASELRMLSNKYPTLICEFGTWNGM